MPLSPEHRRKISESLIRYHSTCKPKKPKTEIQKEIKRLEKRADKLSAAKKKQDLAREVAKLKRML